MQKSAQTLTTSQEQALFDQFTTLLSDLGQPAQMKAFLELFFSETEQAVFAKRLAILQSLHEGKSYEEISQELKVSSATISSIAPIKEHPTAQRILQLIRRDQQLRRLLSLSF